MKNILLILILSPIIYFTSCSSGDSCDNCKAAAKSMGIDATPSLHKKLCNGKEKSTSQSRSSQSGYSTCDNCKAAAKSMGIDATPSLHKKLCDGEGGSKGIKGFRDKKKWYSGAGTILVYRQHLRDPEGMYTKRDIGSGRKCRTSHYEKRSAENSILSSKDDAKDRFGNYKNNDGCIEVPILLVIQFITNDSLIIKRFYSDAEEIKEEDWMMGELSMKNIYDNIYATTSCDEIIFKSKRKRDYLNFREVISSYTNTNTTDEDLVHRFELRFSNLFEENETGYRNEMFGTEIDSDGKRWDVAFSRYALDGKKMGKALIEKSTWFDEIGWIKGENGKWEWDSLGIYEDYGS